MRQPLSPTQLLLKLTLTFKLLCVIECCGERKTRNTMVDVHYKPTQDLRGLHIPPKTGLNVKISFIFSRIIGPFGKSGRGGRVQI